MHLAQARRDGVRSSRPGAAAVPPSPTPAVASLVHRAAGAAARPPAVQPGPGARALRQHHRGGRLPDDAATVAGQDVLHGAAVLVHGRPIPVPRGRAPPGAPVAAVHAVPGPAGLVVRRIVAVLVARVHRLVVRRGRGRRGRATLTAADVSTNVRPGPGKYPRPIAVISYAP